MSSTIDNLPSGAPAQPGDELPIQRGANNFKLSIADIVADVPATSPGGNPGDIQYNNSGSFGGVAQVPLAKGGTNVDLSASGSSTAVLAQDASHVISARALVAADIPNLDASKITTGAIALARGGTGVDLSASGSVHAFLAEDGSHVISARQPAASDISGLAPSATTDTTNASNINSGKLALAEGGTNVDLSASGSSTAVLAQDASHVISARALVAADIPNLDAAKITTGALALARGGTAVDLSASGSATAILAQDGSHVISARALVAADIPSLDASKITTGQIALARGGTNADLSATGGANQFLKQTSSGGAVTVAALVAGDVPTGIVTWDLLGNAAGALTLSNAGNATTFNQTSAVNWTWANTTAATSGTPQSSPILNIKGTYWNGAASASDSFTLQNVIGIGTNAAAQLTIAHSGTSGEASVVVPGGTAGTAPGFRFGSAGYGLAATASVLSLMNGTNAAGGPTLRGYVGTGSAYTISADILWATSSSTPTGISLIAQANINSAQTMALVGTGGTSNTAPAVFLSGNGGNNAKDFLATSGTQTAVLIGTIGNQRIVFSPASGSANFLCLNVSPTINQTGTASGSYTALQVNVIETALKGSANKLLDLQAGTTGGTSEFAVSNSGKVVTYGAIATIGGGVPAEYATVDLTAQAAAIGATTLYAVPAGGAGRYRVSWVASVTTVDGAASVLGGAGGFQILYTDSDDSVVKTSPRTVTAGVDTDATNTTATAISGCIIVNAKASTNIQYQMGYTSTTPGQMKYNLHVVMEAL